MSLYEDGVLIGTEKTQADLSVLKGANNALIGYGQFKNDILKVWLQTLRSTTML